MSARGTTQKCRPPRRKAAHGSKADSGKPSASLFMSSRPRWNGLWPELCCCFHTAQTSGVDISYQRPSPEMVRKLGGIVAFLPSLASTQKRSTPTIWPIILGQARARFRLSASIRALLGDRATARGRGPNPCGPSIRREGTSCRLGSVASSGAGIPELLTGRRNSTR